MKVFVKFISDKTKTFLLFPFQRITDGDIESLVIHKTIQSKPMWSLGGIQVFLDLSYYIYEAVIWQENIGLQVMHWKFGFYVTFYNAGNNGCNLQVTHGNVGFSTATVKLIVLDGTEKIACSVGEGPVDASYKAINSIVQVRIETSSYYLRLPSAHLKHFLFFVMLLLLAIFLNKRNSSTVSVTFWNISYCPTGKGYNSIHPAVHTICNFLGFLYPFWFGI